jgi:hypothetical protein
MQSGHELVRRFSRFAGAARRRRRVDERAPPRVGVPGGHPEEVTDQSIKCVERGAPFGWRCLDWAMVIAMLVARVMKVPVH